MSRRDKLLLPVLLLLAIVGIKVSLDLKRKLAPRPNLILITIDTLRADHLSFCGYERDTAPNLARLADRSMLFTRVAPTAPYTVPSVVSILTGTYQHTHRARYQPGELKQDLTTLAERLSEQGYQTGAVVGSPILTEKLGYAQGFQIFQGASEVQKAPAMTDKALELLGSLEPERPFFLWVHYMDPHWPYTPPRKWAEKFAPDVPWGEPFQYLNSPPYSPERMIFHNDLDEESIQQAVGLYDAEIASADEQIGRLLDLLTETGLMDNTVVAVTSDHGESLGEHDLHFAHAMDLYEPSQRVFLILSHPGVAPARVDTPVSLIDLYPTLLDLLDVQAEDTEGGSLLQGSGSDTVFAENSPFHPWFYEERPRIYQFGAAGVWTMAMRGPWKLIRVPGPEGAPPSFELYNVRDDPGETNNLAGEEKEIFDSLRKELEQWIRSRPGSVSRISETPNQIQYAPDVDQTTLQGLKDLGYMN